MTSRHIASALLLALTAAACGVAGETTTDGTAALATRADAPADAGVDPGFDWPVPDQWSPETDAFPVYWAPSLPYAGIEVLRFSPHFYDPTADDYFSYSFAWLTQPPAAPAVSADELGRDLVTYFGGLAQNADPTHFDATLHHAEVTRDADGHYRGVVQTVDGFNNSVPVQFQTDIEVTSCGDRSVVLFTFSPHPSGDAMWTTLLTQRSTFRCTR